MSSEAERLRIIIDELIRVTHGLIESRVSFDTIYGYLVERTEELDPFTQQRVLILLVLEVVKEKEADD